MSSSDRHLRKISILEAQEALLRSGYLLEHRIGTLLEGRGWYVEANDAYEDQDTGKTRELDIYALRGEPLDKRTRKKGFVWAVLLIECVNNLQPLALITKKPALSLLHSEDIKLAGLPAKIFHKKADAWQSIPNCLDMQDYHHYCSGRVATQFCSFSLKKDQSWMASHDDLHFDSLRNLCVALEYAQDKFFRSWKFDSHVREFINLEFYYPLLVLQGGLMEVQASRNGLKIREVKHIQYRRSSIVRGERRDYQIDVVTERFFPRYLSIIEKELRITTDRLRNKRALLHDSLEVIVRSARRLRSPERIRHAMEYHWAGLAL